MTIRHSKSLLLLWRIAEAEARHLHSRSIEPEHFFLAELKIVDIDLKNVVRRLGESLEDLQPQVDDLKRNIRDYILDSTQMRRRLRKSLLNSSASPPNDTRLRRSITSRAAFARAENLSLARNGEVTPSLLLIALLDPTSPAVSQVLYHFGVDPSALKKHLICCNSPL